MAKNMSVEEIDFTGGRLLAIPTLYCRQIHAKKSWAFLKWGDSLAGAFWHASCGKKEKPLSSKEVCNADGDSEDPCSDFCCRLSYPSIRKTSSGARIAQGGNERK